MPIAGTYPAAPATQTQSKPTQPSTPPSTPPSTKRESAKYTTPPAQPATFALSVCRGYARTGVCPSPASCIYQHPIQGPAVPLAAQPEYAQYQYLQALQFQQMHQRRQALLQQQMAQAQQTVTDNGTSGPPNIQLQQSPSPSSGAGATAILTESGQRPTAPSKQQLPSTKKGSQRAQRPPKHPASNNRHHHKDSTKRKDGGAPSKPVPMSDALIDNDSSSGSYRPPGHRGRGGYNPRYHNHHHNQHDSYEQSSGRRKPRYRKAQPHSKTNGHVPHSQAGGSSPAKAPSQATVPISDTDTSDTGTAHKPDHNGLPKTDKRGGSRSRRDYRPKRGAESRRRGGRKPAKQSTDGSGEGVPPAKPPVPKDKVAKPPSRNPKRRGPPRYRRRGESKQQLNWRETKVPSE